MSNKIVVSTTIDKDTKRQAETALESMGLTFTDAVRYLFATIATKKILPFSPLIPNTETLAAMQELESDELRSFYTVKDLFEN